MIFFDACCQEILGRMILYEIDARLLSVRHRKRSLQLVCGGAFRAEVGRFELLPAPFGWWCSAHSVASRQVGCPLGCSVFSVSSGDGGSVPGSGGAFPAGRSPPRVPRWFSLLRRLLARSRLWWLLPDLETSPLVRFRKRLRTPVLPCSIPPASVLELCGRCGPSLGLATQKFL